MDPQALRLRHLLHAYTSGTATPGEQSELMALIRMPEHEEAVKELIAGEMELLELTDWEMETQLSEERATRIQAKILGHKSFDRPVLRSHRKFIIRPWAWRAAAAVLILLAVMGGYRYLARNQPQQVASIKPLPLKDVLPGSNKAVLTLANGITITLDSAHSGRLAKQGGVTVTKLDSGRLADTLLNEKPNQVLYNTLRTPRGGQYRVILPDGSQVWLNAASSITYPTAFVGADREVQITGEVYFEIAKDERMPFVVKTGKTRTTVLGTHFNVNAYGDEGTLTTTLLEGAVKFSCEEGEKILRPGQQAVLNEADRSMTIGEADTWQAVAWKNGQFDFDNKGVPAIMRQISRWYDVDISYQSTYDGAKFGGGISRQLNLSDVLRLLDKNGIHTRFEDRKIIVLP